MNRIIPRVTIVLLFNKEYLKPRCESIKQQPLRSRFLYRYRQIESYFTKQNMCVFVYAHVLNNTDSYKMAEKNIL